MAEIKTENREEKVNIRNSIARLHILYFDKKNT